MRTNLLLSAIAIDFGVKPTTLHYNDHGVPIGVPFGVPIGVTHVLELWIPIVLAGIFRFLGV
jgi:hypothetical protein